jgi:hypothetical protein
MLKVTELPTDFFLEKIQVEVLTEIGTWLLHNYRVSSFRSENGDSLHGF